MKRTTYLVTIEHPHGEAGFVIDESDIIESIRLECGIPDNFIIVTETTAVHAKEREVLSAALDMMEKNHVPGIEGLEAWGESIVVLNAKARELRALMEGKA